MDHFWPEKQQQWNNCRPTFCPQMTGFHYTDQDPWKQFWLDIWFLTHPFNIYLLSVKLCTVEVGDAPCHLITGGHCHQAITLGTRAASICNHLGAQNLLVNNLISTFIINKELKFKDIYKQLIPKKVHIIYLPIFAKQVLQISCFGVWRQAAYPNVTRRAAVAATAANNSWWWHFTKHI